jgi:hypothetical protein
MAYWQSVKKKIHLPLRTYNPFYSKKLHFLDAFQLPFVCGIPARSFRAVLVFGQ